MQSETVVPQSSPHQFHWNAYFAHYGCISCGLKSEPHDGHGFCKSCREHIVNQLRTILREPR